MDVKKPQRAPLSVFRHCETLGFFNIHSGAEHQKNAEGPFGEKISEKNVSQCRKKLKGGPFGVARYGMLRGKTGKTFLAQLARSNGAI